MNWSCSATCIQAQLPSWWKLKLVQGEVLIWGPVNSVSYGTDCTVVFQQQQYKEHSYQPKKWAIDFEGIKIWKKVVWQQPNSVQHELNFPVVLVFSVSNWNFLAISTGDVDLVVVNETLKRALVLWNRAAAQGRVISSLAPQALCLIYSLGTRP